MLDVIVANGPCFVRPSRGWIQSVLEFPIFEHDRPEGVDELVVLLVKLLALETLNFTVQMEKHGGLVLTFAACIEIKIGTISVISNVYGMLTDLNSC